MKNLRLFILAGIAVSLSACSAVDIADSLGINITPVVKAGPDKIAEVNQAVIITGVATDIDGTIVSYEWTKDSTGEVLATTDSFDYIPTEVGTDTLTLTVMDDDGETDSDSMNVTVS